MRVPQARPCETSVGGGRTALQAVLAQIPARGCADGGRIVPPGLNASEAGLNASEAGRGEHTPPRSAHESPVTAGMTPRAQVFRSWRAGNRSSRLQFPGRGNVVPFKAASARRLRSHAGPKGLGINLYRFDTLCSLLVYSPDRISSSLPLKVDQTCRRCREYGPRTGGHQAARFLEAVLCHVNWG